MLSLSSALRDLSQAGLEVAHLATYEKSLVQAVKGSTALHGIFEGAELSIEHGFLKINNHEVSTIAKYLHSGELVRGLELIKPGIKLSNAAYKELFSVVKDYPEFKIAKTTRQVEALEKILPELEQTKGNIDKLLENLEKKYPKQKKGLLNWIKNNKKATLVTSLGATIAVPALISHFNTYAETVRGCIRHEFKNGIEYKCKVIESSCKNTKTADFLPPCKPSEIPDNIKNQKPSDCMDICSHCNSGKGDPKILNPYVTFQCNDPSDLAVLGDLFSNDFGNLIDIVKELPETITKVVGVLWDVLKWAFYGIIFLAVCFLGVQAYKIFKPMLVRDDEKTPLLMTS